MSGALPILSDAAAVLALDDTHYTCVDVPEWRCQIRLKSLSGEELDAFSAQTTRKVSGRNGVMRREVDEKGFKVRLIMRAAVTADGQRLFADDAYAALLGKNAGVINRLFDAASRLSGLSDTEVERLGNDSSETDGDASPSVSPLP